MCVRDKLSCLLKKKKKVEYNVLVSGFISEMGIKAKKVMKKKLKKASSHFSVSARKNEAPDFLVCCL